MNTNTAPHEAFGSCPQCHQLADLVNVGTEQKGVCYDHKVAWPICSFRQEDAFALGDPDKIAEYQIVEPFFPPEEKDMYESLKARRANMGRRLIKKQ